MTNDDDETASHRAGEPPQRPTIPLSGRGSKSRQQIDDFGERPDDAPTMFDPNVPTGARGASEDERRTNQASAQPDPFPDIDDSDHPTGATVIGKRRAGSGAPKNSGQRRDAPEVRAKAKRPPMQSDVAIRSGSAGLDDSARTKRWEPPQLMADAEPTGPAMRPPPAPSAPQAIPRPPVLPLPPQPQSEPIRMVSMKPPAAVIEKQARPVPDVRVRGMAEVHQTPPRGMGFLAPPRDPKEARSRRWRDNVIWGSVAVIVAAVVMLAVWFIAR